MAEETAGGGEVAQRVFDALEALKAIEDETARAREISIFLRHYGPKVKELSDLRRDFVLDQRAQNVSFRKIAAKIDVSPSETVVTYLRLQIESVRHALTAAENRKPAPPFRTSSAATPGPARPAHARRRVRMQPTEAMPPPESTGIEPGPPHRRPATAREVLGPAPIQGEPCRIPAREPGSGTGAAVPLRRILPGRARTCGCREGVGVTR